MPLVLVAGRLQYEHLQLYEHLQHSKLRCSKTKRPFWLDQ